MAAKTQRPFTFDASRQKVLEKLEELRNPTICKVPAQVLKIYELCEQEKIYGSICKNSAKKVRNSADLKIHNHMRALDFIIKYLTPYIESKKLQDRLRKAPSPLMTAETLLFIRKFFEGENLKNDKFLQKGTTGLVFLTHLHNEAGDSSLGLAKKEPFLSVLPKLNSISEKNLFLCTEEGSHVAKYYGMIKTSSLHELYDGDLIDHTPSFTPEIFYQAVHDIARGVQFLHEYKGQIIGDLRLENILYKKTSTGYSFAITDLDDSQPAAENPMEIKAARFSAPPEFWRKIDPFTLSFDSWCFGIFILDILCFREIKAFIPQKESMCSSIMRKITSTFSWVFSRKTSTPVELKLNQMKAELNKRIALGSNDLNPETTECLKKGLNRIEEFDPGHHYLSLAIDCLKIDPQERPNIQIILERLADIEAVYECKPVITVKE